MKTVLVTAIGTVTASNIVRELKKAGDYYIIGADINNQNEVATSLDVDEYYKFPLAASDNYISFVVEFCSNHKVDYYFPVIDIEVVKVSRYRDYFVKIGTKTCTANYEFVEIVHYKNKFVKWVEEYIPEIAIKTYDNTQEITETHFPLFIKPIEGVASIGCKKINSLAELEIFVDNNNIGRYILLQEYVQGANITVDTIRNKKTGQKAHVQRKELLRNANGCGIAVEIVQDEVLTKICDFLAEQLDLDGVVNMEFFKTDKGYKIIEINPRLSAGSVFTCMSGINTVLNSMKIADDEACIFGPVTIGAHFAERYEAYRMD